MPTSQQVNKTQSGDNNQNGAIPKKTKSKSKPFSETAEVLKSVPDEVVNNNLDEVLEKCKIIDNQCDYEKCEKKTNLMGQDCKYCQKRYCFKHGLPEIHGCGEDVKKDERRQFLAPVPLKTVRKQQDLQKAKVKLQGKLKDMSQSRKQKQPPLKPKK